MTEAETPFAARVPKVGDQVWFYFRHAFGTPGTAREFHPASFTGKMEMRFRRASVAELISVVPDRVINQTTGLGELGTFDLALDVTFDPDDRILLPGGVVFAPDRLQCASAHRGGPDYRVGQVGGAWPEHLTWAWDPMPGLEGGR